MKVALYSLTRDRLDYTKHCLATWKDKAGYPFDLFVVDNGSEDGTPEWLMAQKEAGVVKDLVLNSVNRGIFYGSNQGLDLIGGNYDLISRVDNDGEFVCEDTIKKVVEVYGEAPYRRLLVSPRVEGLRHQPQRIEFATVNGHQIGFTVQIGGIFAALPAVYYQQFRFDHKTGPMGRGDDDQFCKWVIETGGRVGYVEDVFINHYESTDGQVARYPDYFKRKSTEETSAYPYAD